MKKTYEHIFSFRILDAVENGETVFILDKANRDVICAGDLTLDEYVDMRKIENEDPNRFVIWVERIDKEENENAEKF